MAGLRTVYLLVTKDLLVELRNRETFTVMLFFAVVILFLFHFSLNPERENTDPACAWAAVVGLCVHRCLGPGPFLSGRAGE